MRQVLFGTVFAIVMVVIAASFILDFETMRFRPDLDINVMVRVGIVALVGFIGFMHITNKETA